MMPASIDQFSKSSEEKHEFAAPEHDNGHDVADVVARGHTNSSIVIDEATNKRLFWRINRRVLPWMIVAYIAQAMDKGLFNPCGGELVERSPKKTGVSGSASVMGLIQDTVRSSLPKASLFTDLTLAHERTRCLPLPMAAFYDIWLTFLIKYAFTSTALWIGVIVG